MAERYEYSPYGQRTVYSHGWLLGDVNDDGHMDGTDISIMADAINMGGWQPGGKRGRSYL